MYSIWRYQQLCRCCFVCVVCFCQCYLFKFPVCFLVWICVLVWIKPVQVNHVYVLKFVSFCNEHSSTCVPKSKEKLPQIVFLLYFYIHSQVSTPVSPAKIRISDLWLKWITLATNGTNSGLFRSDFRTFWVSDLKKFPFGAILTHFGCKSTIRG